jgi:gas vesicle protein
MSGIIVGSIISAGASIFGAVSAGKRAKRAQKEKTRLTGELDTLERNRQSIINPYEGVTDLSAMVSDLSSIASNPFDSLSVSTAGAEMQAEQTDLALANTLDTLRSTGASAGGATALARMALESKKGALMGEAGRIQQADVSGKEFVYSEKERRETEQLNRKQAQITGQAQAAAQARSDQSAAISSGINAIGNIAGSVAMAGGGTKKTGNTE